MSFSLWTPVLSGAIFSSPSVAAFLFLVFLMLAVTWVGTLVTMVAITWDGCRRAQRWTSAHLVLLLACSKVSKKNSVSVACRTATNVSIFPECEHDILRTLEVLLSALTLLQWCALRILAGQMDGDRFPATAKWVLDRVNTVGENLQQFP